MKSYIPNNINFRIVSSNAIAKFKQDQAYDFNEINQNKNCFSGQAREVILLEYDHWFKWIVKLEKVFLMLSEDDDIELLYQKTNILLQNEMDDITEIMSVYTDYFSTELTSYMKFIHRYSFETLSGAVKTALKDNDVFSAYSRIVYLLSLYLQQVLLALQEIEQIMKREQPVAKIFFSDWCNEALKIDNIYPLVKRVDFFKSKFNVSEFEIINHSNNVIPEACITSLKDLGISLSVKDNK